MKIKISLLIFLLLFFNVLFLGMVGAEEGEEIKALEVQGNERVSTLIILAKIETKVGDKFSSLLLRDDVKRLYDLGFFSSVDVDVTEHEDGVKVTFILEEEFLIKEINLEGNQGIKGESLSEIMSLKTGDVFNKYLLKEDVDKIISLYKEKGYYLVKVTSGVDQSEEEKEIIINIKIKEGTAIKVKAIYIEGNYFLTDKIIKKSMATRVDRLFNRGIFKEEDFQDDLKRIVSLYENNGFIKARVVDADRNVDESRGLVYINLKVEEGQRFTAGKISLEGNKLFPMEDIIRELKMLEGDVYSPYALHQDVGRIKLFYAHNGYIFADIRERTYTNEERKKVDITYRIREGQLAYVDKIKIRGNIKTKDKVLRRELTIHPGDVFDARKIERSRQKLYNLAYFDEVSYDVVEGSAPNKRNLVFEVVERKTGSLMFGFGYSSIDDFIGFIEVSQNNFDISNPPYFTGGGQRMKIRTQFGTEKQEYDLSFTEPWLFDRPLSFGFDIYDTSRDWSDYDEKRQGGRLRLSYPLGEFTRGFLTYKLEDVEITDVNESASDRIKQEKGSFITSSWRVAVTKDTRDNVLAPASGYENTVSAELAGGLFGGDRDFTKYMAETSWYFQTFRRWEKLILNLRLKGGLVEEYDDSDYVPIYEKFYLGGANSVRGYAYRDIGPKDEHDEPIGGEVFAQFNAEYTNPIIRNIKGAVFFDSGGVWEDTGNLNGSGVKSGAGVGLRLSLPIGPVRLDYGYGLDGGGGRVHFSGGWNF